jgi:hypothetical protein
MRLPFDGRSGGYGFHMSTQKLSESAPLDHRIVIAVTEAGYRAYTENAWRRRMGLSEFGRELLGDAGALTMPTGAVGLDGSVEAQG